MGKNKHGKKKHQKCCEEKYYHAPVAIMALDFAEDLGDVMDMIRVGYDEQTDQLRDVVACTREMSSDERAREDFFSQLTEEELSAYEMLDNFVNCPPAGLPDDIDSLESRVEHAEWNTPEYREGIALTVSYFDGTLTQYLYLQETLGEENKFAPDFLADLQEQLDEMVLLARELECYFQIERASMKVDQVSVEFDNNLTELDILREMLSEVQEQLSGDDEVDDEDDGD